MSIDHGKLLALAKKLAPLKAMPFEFDNGPAGDDQWCVCTKDSNLTGCDMDKEDAELFAYAVNALAQPAEAVECNRNCDCVGECKAGIEGVAQPAEAVECNRNCDCVGECKAGIEGVAQPAEAVDGPLPPEAVEVFPSALNGGTALPGDWAIPRAPGINRIVDARMAYGWNECRKEMRRRLTLAAGDDVTDAAQGAVAGENPCPFCMGTGACMDCEYNPGLCDTHDAATAAGLYVVEWIDHDEKRREVAWDEEEVSFYISSLPDDAAKTVRVTRYTHQQAAPAQGDVKEWVAGYMQGANDYVGGAHGALDQDELRADAEMAQRHYAAELPAAPSQEPQND